MTQPQIEHLTVQTDRPAAAAAPQGFWPPLPVGLWLPPAAAVLAALAAVTALCLSGRQSTPEAPAGWLEPHNTPALIAWIAALAAVFLAPQVCAPTVPIAAGIGHRLLQAAAVALPIGAVAWAFHSIGILLAGPNAMPTAMEPTGAAAIDAHLPPGLLFAATLAIVAGGAWLWIRPRPIAGTVALAAWSALPPLTWFLAVDILGREQTPYPAWLTVNPVYLPVLIARQPQAAAWWALLVLPALLIALPIGAAGVTRLRRKPSAAAVEA